MKLDQKTIHEKWGYWRENETNPNSVTLQKKI